MIPVLADGDIVEARKAARALATLVGFGGVDVVMIATAVSEVTRNIIEHAKTGELVLTAVERSSQRGLEVVARDRGPGIADVPQAMEDGFSTSKGLGLGLPGSRRLMDEFEVDSRPGVGTTITMRKWLK